MRRECRIGKKQELQQLLLTNYQFMLYNNHNTLIHSGSGCLPVGKRSPVKGDFLLYGNNFKPPPSYSPSSLQYIFSSIIIKGIYGSSLYIKNGELKDMRINPQLEAPQYYLS